MTQSSAARRPVSNTLTPQPVSALDHLDRDFELAAAACVAVEMPAASEGLFHRQMQRMGYFVEQSEDHGDTLTCFLRPDYAHMQGLLLTALSYGPVRLPETERGRQIAAGLRRDFLDSELARNLVRNGAFG